MNLNKHQLYVLEQHSESFNIWIAIIRINTAGKSMTIKSAHTVIIRKNHGQDQNSPPV